MKAFSSMCLAAGIVLILFNELYIGGNAHKGNWLKYTSVI